MLKLIFFSFFLTIVQVSSGHANNPDELSGNTENIQLKISSFTNDGWSLNADGLVTSTDANMKASFYLKAINSNKLGSGGLKTIPANSYLAPLSGYFAMLNPQEEYSLYIRSSENYNFHYSEYITIPAYVGRPLDCNAVGECSLAYFTGGDNDWSISQTSYDGTLSFKSGTIDHDENTWVSTTFEGPGTISFWVKSSNQQGADEGAVQYSGDTSDEFHSGETDWIYHERELNQGPQYVTWLYRKDSSISSGQDCVWIDKVKYTKYADLDDSYSIDLADAIISLKALTNHPTPTVQAQSYINSYMDQNNRLGLSEVIYILRLLGGSE